MGRSRASAPISTSGGQITMWSHRGGAAMASKSSASGTITPRDGWIDYWFSLPDTRQIRINVNASAGAGLGSVFDSSESFSPASLLTPQVTVALVGLACLALVPVVYKLVKARAR